MPYSAEEGRSRPRCSAMLVPSPVRSSRERVWLGAVVSRNGHGVSGSYVSASRVLVDMISDIGGGIGRARIFRYPNENIDEISPRSVG